jgi:hypothetical protein
VEVRGQSREDVFVDWATRDLQSLSSVKAQGLVIPGAGCNTDYGHVEVTGSGQVVQSREQLPSREVAGDSE